jgi:hypothetical protein
MNTVAQTRTFDDWVVTVDDDGTSIYAATVNDSGEMFAEMCFLSSGSCNWVLGISTACKEDHVYAVLANSSITAKALDITCLKELGDGTHVYSFEWKPLESVIKGASWVGMAIPMEGDAFQVVRFSLKGLDASTKLLESTFLKAMEKAPKPQGTKTQIM